MPNCLGSRWVATIAQEPIGLLLANPLQLLSRLGFAQILLGRILRSVGPLNG